jgi:hypothetical protein
LAKTFQNTGKLFAFTQEFFFPQNSPIFFWKKEILIQFTLEKTHLYPIPSEF